MAQKSFIRERRRSNAVNGLLEADGSATAKLMRQALGTRNFPTLLYWDNCTMTKSHWQSRLGITLAIAAMAGCVSKVETRQPVQSHSNAQVTDLSRQQKEIKWIENSYSCNMDKYQDVYNYVNSYLRESNVYTIKALNNVAYRNHVTQEMKVADKYISPNYLKKYYITPNSSIIEDAYGDARPPKLICITESPDETYEVLIFTYSHKKMDYAVIDKLTVVTENREKYLLPSHPPERVTPEESKLYSDLGVPAIPTSAIHLLQAKFRQRP